VAAVPSTHPGRTAPRHLASAVPSITGIMISPPGFKATLVDISASGLLAEWGVPLKIGQAVTVKFEGPFVPASVEAQVVRSVVASMTSTGLRYHVAVTFNAPLKLENDAPAAPAAEKTTGPRAIAEEPPSDDVVNRW
jgi:PilZ domain